jgi:predicted nucleic acid-binding protein
VRGAGRGQLAPLRIIGVTLQAALDRGVGDRVDTGLGQHPQALALLVGSRIRASTSEPSHVSAPVVAEVGYLLGRAGGAKIEAAFLRSIVRETLTIVDLEPADYERMAELVETYADFPLGTTDAAVVAVAEQLEVSEIATLDRRPFHAVRPRHTGGFQLLP